jgi:DNA/RNA-binding domain of Phe-tRNA-synthetase-like protein
MQVTVDKRVAKVWHGDVILGICTFSGLKKDQFDKDGIETFLIAEENSIKQLGKSVLRDPMVEKMRATFQGMPNMNPKRHMPASEALITRIIDLKKFRFFPLVDLNNALSMKIRIPLGIYDLNKLNNSYWEYRLGYPGDTYFTISNKQMNATDRLVLADANGIFGSPIQDSNRGTVSPDTDNITIVSYLPMGLSIKEANDICEVIQEMFTKLCRPETTTTDIVANRNRVDNLANL